MKYAAACKIIRICRILLSQQERNSLRNSQKNDQQQFIYFRTFIHIVMNEIGSIYLNPQQKQTLIEYSSTKATLHLILNFKPKSKQSKKIIFINSIIKLEMI